MEKMINTCNIEVRNLKERDIGVDGKIILK
jgi:hypothetical protein